MNHVQNVGFWKLPAKIYYFTKNAAFSPFWIKIILHFGDYGYGDDIKQIKCCILFYNII